MNSTKIDFMRNLLSNKMLKFVSEAARQGIILTKKNYNLYANLEKYFKPVTSKESLEDIYNNKI